MSYIDGTLITAHYGEEIISGATSGSQINFASDILSSSIAGDDLFVSTADGILIVRDARNKILNLADAVGNIQTRAYVSGDAGTIDGRIFGEREVIYGADFADNEIYAGDDGSQLWGGSYGNDNLIGGNVVDEFVAGGGCGSDTIFNADSNDVINLAATSLAQIIGSNVNSNGVALTFGNGSTLTVSRTVGATFALADGSTHVADQSTGQFTRTN